jgi:hypothetical protein
VNGYDNSNRIVVYLSRHEVPPATKGNYGHTIGSNLVCLADGEFQEIKSLVQLLSKRRITSPGTFAGLVDSLFSLNQPELDFMISPAKSENIESLQVCPTICLGGVGWNRATELYLQDAKYLLDFMSKQIDPKYDVGYLAKFYAPRHRKTVIVAAGAGINGTRAAVRHLVSMWNQLQKMYGDQNFIITFVCPHRVHDDEGYKKAILTETDESVQAAWDRFSMRGKQSTPTPS